MVTQSLDEFPVVTRPWRTSFGERFCRASWALQKHPAARAAIDWLASDARAERLLKPLPHSKPSSFSG